ncbi:GntR family transcriptional regulator [Roseomonas populi]|uniref:GntR family transcriptional regulator n=1 Tax=Roseomonas populi TaxID=3121582 RepID=A0ABT1XBI1_9PROT|nr:GntR family transcriptional regulator [Roseomonas pecuniae]MCR0984482.1 GntR family transcriptional regulator [Roseomonas pecuniae]
MGASPTIGDWRIPPARNAGELVFDKLRERILEGEIPHGTRLSEANIAASTGVSRTPVREALTRLLAAGLLRPADPSGVIVVDPLADLEELVLTREALEGCAARLAAGRATPEQVARIAALAAEARRQEAIEPEVRTELNVAFHDAILAATHSPRLIALAEGHRVLFGSRRLMRMLGPEETRTALDDHGEIAAAIARRDGEAAERIARRHLHATFARSIRIARGESSRQE